MRVLVLGGTNFIGPHVVRLLHGQGHEVTVYHRGIHEPELPSAVRHIHSPGAGLPVLHFPSSLTEPPPDVILHMFPVGEDDARAAVARFAGMAQRIVGLSSGDVYRAYGRLLGLEPGRPERVPLAEDACRGRRLDRLTRHSVGLEESAARITDSLTQHPAGHSEVPAHLKKHSPETAGPHFSAERVVDLHV
jgi:NAD(P)-dependent dehydrogenase (short-subunit alcohol dehydrogenase family)